MKIKYPFIIASVFLVSYFTWRAANTGVDFDVFLYAAGKLKAHHDIYMPPFIRNGMQYYYSPLFALLLTPFTSLPNYIPECFWLSLSCFFMYRTWILCAKYFNLDLLTKKYRTLWIGFTFIITFRFVIENFYQAQMTIFLLWAALESLRLFKDKHFLLGAALLALSINIKLMPIVFLPYLFYRGQIKACLLTVMFYIIYLYLPAIFLKADYNNFLLSEWWHTINPFSIEQNVANISGPISLDGMIPIYVSSYTKGIKNMHNFIDLPLHMVALTVNIARLVLVAMIFFFLRSLPFKIEKNSLKEFWEISYMCFVTPIIFPHMQVYALWFTFPAIFYLSYFFTLQLQTEKKINYPVIIYFLIITLCLSPIIGSDIVGRYLFDLFEHQKLVSFACLLLIPLLLFYSPGKLIKQAAKS